MKSFKAAFVAGGNDYSAALERVAGDAELLGELMQIFRADCNFSVMKTAMDAGETEKAFRAAHSLKGSCGMLGMTDLYETMVLLTDELRHGNLEGARLIFPKAEREYGKVVELIDNNL
ncbi:MAG: Hpt domain-containing protein [Bacillota bacterium]|nr:Hpt domain-containing protein [Bacillota bacterium]